ncbi:MAG: leucine-rich repeat protein [Prevotella sp.]|nr:leucine-rich repeat protein [Prevotella sp.]
MKRIALSMLLVCMAFVHSFGSDYTDSNGVTWSFYYDNDASTATITGVSNHGKSLTIPTKVIYSNKEYIVTAFQAYAFSKESIEQVTVPATVKSIVAPSSSYSYYACSWPVEFILKATTPVTLQYKESVGNACFRVPASAYSAYIAADVWKDVAYCIIPQNAQTSFTVNCTAKSNASDVAAKVGEDNLQNVLKLTVSGSINSYDFMVLRNKMVNLRELDLTNANIVANSYEHYTGYHSNANEIGAYMFYQKYTLRSIKLPKTITAIAYKAFYSCSYLSSCEFPVGLKTIGSFAFYNCNKIKSISIPNGIQTIGSDAFYYCENLQTVNIGEGLKTIAESTFTYCPISTIQLPQTLTTIERYSFEYCKSLKTVNLPARLQTIGFEAFHDCTSLEEIRIPSGLQSIGDYAFSGCTSLKDIYTYTIEPVNINQNTFSSWKTSTLHIPEAAKYNYYYNTQWSQFLALVPFDEDYEYFYLNRDFTLDPNARIEGEPDVDINAGSGLIVQGSTVQVLSDVNVNSNGTIGGSIIADGNLTAKNLYMNITVQKNKWYFFCFPYNVNRSDIICDGAYVFRYYDGSERATTGNGGWKNVPASEPYLHAGRGYIFQTNTDGILSLPVSNPDFSGQDQQTNLNTYAASNTQNASWNFVGNPYISYFDMDEMGYDAPVTIWNGSTYTAVRPGDDDYQFAPFQPFFVQKPAGTGSVSFGSEGRMTYLQTQELTSTGAKPSRIKANPNRRIVNLTISGESGEDKTRVVYNADKTADYEMDCDASKFMADGDAPQLWTNGTDGTAYAINERPEGEVTMGFSTATAGEYAISAPRMDRPVFLLDRMLDTTFDLSLGSYTFHTEAGTWNDRFVLLLNGTEATGIDEAASQRDPLSDVYDLQGRKHSEAVQKGTYILKGEKETKKVSIK